MRDAVTRLVEELTLTTLAFGIAIAYGVLDVARAAGQVVVTVTKHVSGDRSGLFDAPLTWTIGGHVLELGQLVSALLEFGLIVGAAAFVYALQTERPEPDVPAAD